MIFITAGSQKFQFNRLFKYFDQLIEQGIITESVFAQIGATTYKPKNYEYVDFLESTEFEKRIEECNILITHAGTGAIVGALKKDKKVIAVPRLKKYGEHVDDHQKQIAFAFTKMNLIESSGETIDELLLAIKNCKERKYSKYVSNTEKFVNDIEDYLSKV